MQKSFLSVGEIIRKVLSTDTAVSGMVGDKIFPVVIDEAKLPYICYKRIDMVQTPVKTSAGASSASVGVACYAQSYGDSIRLAEAVRQALDGVRAEVDGLRMRSCYLSDATEDWQNDAYCQALTFNIKL